jgi:DNA-binding transcriptional MerR regulator
MGRSNLSRQKLTVSELARIAGVGPDSIRQYERIGLVPKAERSSAGYRLWAAREVQYLKWVAPAKRAGFTLHELAEIFRMYRAGRAPCRKVQDLLRQKLAYLDRNVDELSALRAQLRGVFVRYGRDDCAEPPPATLCPSSMTCARCRLRNQQRR